jgi:hypothetical protein
MLKKDKQPTFDESLAKLRGYKFDVSAPGVVAKPAGAVRIEKYGCAAVLAPGKEAPAMVLKGGIVIDGEIGHVLDRGYQKFIKTPSAERPATADHLRALHKFNEELRQAVGGISLYNESMGAVSDSYIYDRVKGRNLPENQRPTPAWEKPVRPGTRGEVS